MSWDCRHVDVMLKNGVICIYCIAGNIGGNYIWRIARKSSKIEIGGF